MSPGTVCRCFTRVCTLNPCRWYDDLVKECTCSPAMVARYQKRISGLLLDRIDIHFEVPMVEYEKLSGYRLGEPSAAIRCRVEAARDSPPQRVAGAAVRGQPAAG